jgi:hypothetical protein
MARGGWEAGLEKVCNEARADLWVAVRFPEKLSDEAMQHALEVEWIEEIEGRLVWNLPMLIR